MSDQVIPQSSFGQRLGLDYERWTLDCVVKIGHAVALDFSDRPELYQQVADDTAAKLADLQANYGFDVNFPDVAIRQRLMKPIFGESDGHGDGNDGSTFQTYRLPVLSAAADFAENAQPTAFAMMRERVRSEIVPFKTHMVDLQGASLSQTERRTTFIFDIAQTILKDPSVFVVFGINGAIDPAWPLQSSDPKGAQLIENITTQLFDLPGRIEREKFVHLQRIGDKGFQSIRIILDTDLEDTKFDIDSLITELYAWGSSLRLVGGARAQPKPPTTQPPETAGAAPNPGQGRSQAAARAQAVLTKPPTRPTNVYNR